MTSLQRSVHAMSSDQASRVKKRGHKREEDFNDKYGKADANINFSGASADCFLSREKEIYSILQEKINTESTSISLKSGNTIQIHLGQIPELTNKETYLVDSLWNGNTCVTHGISKQEQIKKLKDFSFWRKYLKKGDILCYFEDTDKSYTFFKMEDVINFICQKCEWKFLETGRIKGWFFNGAKNKKMQYLTYEYRRKKKQFVLGAHGGKKGREFIQLLKQNVAFHTDR